MHDAFLFFFTVMFLCMANFCLTLQEDKLKRPLSDIESWKLAREQSDSKAGESQYYGRTDPPQMGPPPPPAGEPPHVPTFDEWVALGSDGPVSTFA